LDRSPSGGLADNSDSGEEWKNRAANKFLIVRKDRASEKEAETFLVQNQFNKNFINFQEKCEERKKEEKTAEGRVEMFK